MEDRVIGLADAIASLRAELSDAMQRGADEYLRFRTGPVELEFVVEVGREAGAAGGVQFWVLSAKGNTATTTSASHRIKLTLVPITAAGEDVDISDAVTSRPR